jgi:hypothetical protein
MSETAWLGMGVALLKLKRHQAAKLSFQRADELHKKSLLASQEKG